MKFSQKMPLYLFYTMVQKSQKWPKTQIKGGGGSCLKWLAQLIDFGHDGSTNVTGGCSFAHCIAMVTRNVLECIQQMTARIQAVAHRNNELHSCSTDQERLVFLFQFSEPDFLHSNCYPKLSTVCVCSLWRVKNVLSFGNISASGFDKLQQIQYDKSQLGAAGLLIL